MDGKMLARLGAIVFIAVAVTATAIEMSRDEEPAESWASARPATTPSDPLQRELIRCQALGEAGARDAACLQAWAESRRRFLAPGQPRAERLPDNPPAPTPADPAEAR
ncbi:putative entry exclusion protein TrbK-alt [Filomicrobium sp.]|uniref:putative entry exclusion protein TrbK-alt n=1 Tax=Filomicrobium sp. TaxID=2024831 RepID=UPI00258301C1|nr:putative entry exclusion protein TrbK-alt [Filomicrobium sp.]MCV0368952.1 putative entry exclusion protein TrbK-alt [Filomicrobium sp.]